MSGFWHGANWTFIVWGLLNALFIMPSIIYNKNRVNIDIVAQGKFLPSIKDLFSIGLTFSLTMLAWVFFRSSNLSSAISFIASAFTGLFSIDTYYQALFFMTYKTGFIIFALVFLFFLIEWMGREQKYAIENIGNNTPRTFRWLAYYVMIALVFYYSGAEQQFIYFQF